MSAIWGLLTIAMRIVVVDDAEAVAPPPRTVQAPSKAAVALSAPARLIGVLKLDITLFRLFIYLPPLRTWVSRALLVGDISGPGSRCKFCAPKPAGRWRGYTNPSEKPDGEADIDERECSS
jgi:hypothetical protein